MVQKLVDRLKRTRIKHVIGIIIAAIIIYALINPSISEAVLSFLFGGIVPGTNIVVPPQIMILGAAGIVGLILLTLLIIWLIRVKDVRKASRQLLHDVEHVFEHRSHESDEVIDQPAQMEVETEYQIVQPVADEPVKVPVTIRTPYRVRLAHRAERLYSKLKRIAYHLATLIRRHSGRLGRLVQVYGRAAKGDVRMIRQWWHQIVRPQIVIAVRRLYHMSLQLLATIIALNRLAARAVVQALKRFGRFMHPYALRLDTWLELQYRRLVSWSRRTEAGQIVSVMSSEMLASIRRLLRQFHK